MNLKINNNKIFVSTSIELEFILRNKDYYYNRFHFLVEEVRMNFEFITYIKVFKTDLTKHIIPTFVHKLNQRGNNFNYNIKN